MAVLRRQRAQTGLGWGGILIANRLDRETGLTFDQVVAEFRGGKGWEEIARDHNANLGRLISDVRQSQEAVEQRLEDRTPRVDTTNQPDPASRGGSGPGARAGGGRGRR